MVFLVGVLMTITGFYMMNQPLAGLATLTIILMSYLLATGVIEIIVAFHPIVISSSYYFLVPTLQYGAVLCYGEQPTNTHSIGFSCNWIAIGLFA